MKKKASTSLAASKKTPAAGKKDTSPSPPPIQKRSDHLREKGKIIPVLPDTFYHTRAATAQSIGLKQWPPPTASDTPLPATTSPSHGDAGKTGHQMGHTSSAMVYRTYAQAVRKSQADAWWAI